MSTTKQNAYEVLKLCEDDPDYDHADIHKDICGHIAIHRGLPIHGPLGNFNWKTFVAHIGFEERDWDLWHLLCEDWLPKDVALERFARMIIEVHGYNGNQLPKSLVLL